MGRQGGITFEFDANQLQKIERKLKNMKSKAPQVLKNAVNATAKDAKKDLAKKAKETYAVKSPKFQKAIAMKNATAAKPTATLKITGEAMALSDFKYKKNIQSIGAKGKLYKASSFKSLDLDAKGLKAFVTKFHSGHIAVVRRDPPHKYTRGLMERKQNGGDQTKLKEFYSPSIPRMIGNEKKVYGIVRPNIYQNLQKNIEKQIENVLGGK